MTIPRGAGIALACIALALASGCSLSRPAPAKAYFAIDAGDPPPADAPARAGALRVARVKVPPPFDKETFHYRVGPNQYRADYYVNFIAPPGRLITGELIRWLSASNQFDTVIDASSPVGSDVTLQCVITGLYADYTDRAAPAAVVDATIFLLDESGVDARVLLSTDYHESEPMAEQGSAELARAWGVALGRMFQAMSADLQNLPPASPGG